MLRLFFDIFCNSGILTMKVNRQWVPCVRNSSFSFIPVILKLYGCLNHALKMHMWIEYNKKIILSLFSQFHLVRFFRHLH